MVLVICLLIVDSCVVRFDGVGMLIGEVILGIWGC